MFKRPSSLTPYANGISHFSFGIFRLHNSIAYDDASAIPSVHIHLYTFHLFFTSSRTPLKGDWVDRAWLVIF